VAVFAHTSTPIAIEKLQLDGHAGLKRPHMNVLSVDLRRSGGIDPSAAINETSIGLVDCAAHAIYIGYRLMVGSRNAPPGLRVRTHIRTNLMGNLLLS